MNILYLTCTNDEEAKNIGLALLDAKLVVCVRRSPVRSMYWWDGKINHDDEVLLMIESREDKFDQIEAIITKLHSSSDYVLTTLKVERTTPGVLQWIDETLGD